MLGAEDALFALLVHPAFAKHLGGWDMGLHRVADILNWLMTQPFDWQLVLDRLENFGARTAAWATLRWVELLADSNAPTRLRSMLSDLRPGPVRGRWLSRWLENDLSEKTSGVHLVRLIGFTVMLHDTTADAARAVAGRRRARQREDEDLMAFRELLG